MNLPARMAMVAVALCAWAGPALACPNCIGNDRVNSTLRLVGVFMLVPFALFFVVLGVVRKVQRQGATTAAPSSLVSAAAANGPAPDRVTIVPQ